MKCIKLITTVPLSYMFILGGLYQEQQGFFLPVASMETKDAETLLR
jgi:hypothetical protein